MKSPMPIINEPAESQGWAGSATVASRGPDFWFSQAQKAGTLAEAVVCLNQVYKLDPLYAQAREMRYQIVWRLLEADPFLAYQGESDNLYQVWSNLKLEMIVPKSRAVTEPYPPVTANPLAPGFGWLRWTVIGLLPAGLGALFLAPITAVRTLLIFLTTPLNRADQLRVFVILFLSAVLWAVALFLSFLFGIHVVS